MLAAVKGYYDGTQIIVNEDDRKNLNIGDEVVITILNRIVMTRKETRADRRKKLIESGEFVSTNGRSAEEVDAYIRELRDDDRF